MQVESNTVLTAPDASRPFVHPISDAERFEVIVSPEYPPGRGPEDQPSVLRLAKGDIVWVLEKHPSGWWGGHKEGDETTGWFPGSVAEKRPLSTGDSIDYFGDDENSRAALERDNRAVASPQGSLRSRQGTGMAAMQDENERLAQALANEQAKVQDVEGTLKLEREWKDKYSEDVRRLEAENMRIRKERDAEKQGREHERRSRELNEKKHQMLEAKERTDGENTQRLEGEVSRLQQELVAKEGMLQQKQAEINQLHEMVNILQVNTSIVQREASHCSQRQAPSPDVSRRDVCRPAENSMLSEKSMQHPGTPQGSGSRDDATCRALGRQASSSISRQLFQHPVADDVPLSARGMHRHTSEPGQMLAPNTHSGIATAPVSAVRVVSAVNGQPPRPSPRGPATAQSTPLQPWRSHSQGAAVAASPRGAKAIAAMQGIDSRPAAAAQVRTLVSEYERRSTSRTPCGTARNYEGQATPTRAASGGASARAVSANAPCASARAPSHGRAPVAMAMPFAESRGRQQMPVEDAKDLSEAPLSSPMGSEDTHAVVFGMSPISGRPRGERSNAHAPMGRVGPRMASPSPSPQQKGPSVQDRIRAFQRH